MDSKGNYLWLTGQPSAVLVRWGPNNEFEALVPVMDRFGRIGGRELSSMNLEEAWSQLDGYPNPVWEEDSEDDVDGLITEEVSQETSQLIRRTESYPIRKMMEFIEKIAEKNTAISESDWKYWCNRLEQSLVYTKDSEEYELFRQMNLNPFSVLRNEAFRPDYAVDSSTPAGDQARTRRSVSAR